MESVLYDFAGVTEAAALASYPWIGRGKKIKADDAATCAMRERLNRMSIKGSIVIGEGEMDEAPMLYIGEAVGQGGGPELDIAVDPLEGTNLTVTGSSHSIAVIAAAPKGMLLQAPDMYMDKIAVGPKAAGQIDIEAPLPVNMRAVAAATGKRVDELCVMIQNRERHKELVRTVLDQGARVRLFDDGDVSFSIAAALDLGLADLFVGIGGSPEGVISAVALRCLGGEMQARLLPANATEFERCVGMGLSHPGRPLGMEQLTGSGDCLFAATGITEGLFLRGVRESPGGRSTHTLLLHSKGRTKRFIETHHSSSLKN
ncbi:fructose-1,6-bisphosphatase II [Paenibacillaceae bacterium GAS479]|nr:fructose-1,6-bisphosphatase II [Paenibacillaceae bacterium GAS479]